MNPTGTPFSSTAADSQSFLFMQMLETLNTRRFACKVWSVAVAFASVALIAFGIDGGKAIWAAVPAVALVFLDASLASKSRDLAEIAKGPNKDTQKLAQLIGYQAPRRFKVEAFGCISGMLKPSVIFYYLTLAGLSAAAGNILKNAKVDDGSSSRAGRLPPVQIVSPQNTPFVAPSGFPPIQQSGVRRQVGGGSVPASKEGEYRSSPSLGPQVKQVPISVPQGNAGPVPTPKPQAAVPKAPAASQTAPVQGVPQVEAGNGQTSAEGK